VAIALLPICAPVAEAEFFFGEPANLESVLPFINAADESIDSLSYDGLEMYILSFRSGGHGESDIWVLRRNSIEDDWLAPENLGSAVNSPGMEQGASISADGLTLLFQSDRPDGHGGEDMYMATRSTTTAPWGQAVNMGPGLNSSSHDNYPCMSPDGLELYFSSNRPDGFGSADLWVTTRATPHDAWGPPENLGPVINSTHADMDPKLSSDGRILFFSGHPQDAAYRLGGHGGADIWMTRRETLSAPWQVPVNLGPQVNDSQNGLLQRISPDGSALYFSTVSAGVWENWVASILPVVDFNGDGRVDGKEVLAVTNFWGTDDSTCDIGLMPWGDGVVDVEDVKALAEYIGKNVDDSTLIVHWAMDETEGAIAQDTGDTCDAAVIGTPVWHPDAGRVDGALELDGSTFATTDHVLNPGDGPFSVLAWIKTDVPGQVIISQADGANWLRTDPMDGSLMTELKGTGRDSCLLCSETIMADGSWHRIALVCDGEVRSLHVDEIMVAQDTQAGGPAGCTGGLNIGCDKDMIPGSFFTGLIDDVRIYDRVVRP
jgi:hypothetical protein